MNAHEFASLDARGLAPTRSNPLVVTSYRSCFQSGSRGARLSFSFDKLRIRLALRSELLMKRTPNSWRSCTQNHPILWVQRDSTFSHSPDGSCFQSGSRGARLSFSFDKLRIRKTRTTLRASHPSRTPNSWRSCTQNHPILWVQRDSTFSHSPDGSCFQSGSRGARLSFSFDKLRIRKTRTTLRASHPSRTPNSWRSCTQNHPILWVQRDSNPRPFA